MDYLRRLSQLASLTGYREQDSAPKQEKGITSLHLETAGQGVHYVIDKNLSKAVLGDSRSFVQDTFLRELLDACPEGGTRWISWFVKRSPEFLDGAEHSEARRRLSTHLRLLLELTRSSKGKVIGELSTLDQHEKPLTSLDLAERLVNAYYVEALSRWFGQPVTIDQILISGPDVFTPSLRARKSVLTLEKTLDRFIIEQVPAHLRDDDSAMLTILSLFLMAVKPVVGGLTCLFNAVLEADNWDSIDQNAFRSYSMAPTNFVARRCARDRELGGQQVREGDIVYAMLFESSGCPFKKGLNLAFGRGKHLCPGSAIAKEIMGSVVDAMPPHAALAKEHLLASDVVIGLPSTFLSFKA